jgi:hypothetical protein
LNAPNRPGLIGVTGIALMAIDGLIHFSLVPHSLEHASYLEACCSWPTPLTRSSRP